MTILSPIFCFVLAPEIHPALLNVSNITWNAFNLSWNSIDSPFIPGILRFYRVTYRIIDTHPAFDRSNHSFLVDSRFTATPVTGLQGFTNYQVMVAGVTVKDGPVNVAYMKTDEGGESLTVSTCFKLTRHHFINCAFAILFSSYVATILI